MKKVILEGNERTVNQIIRENRIRVGRGLVKFSPAEDAAPERQTSEEAECDTDSKDIEADAKDIVPDDTKEPGAEDVKDIEADAKEVREEKKKVKTPK